jgi:PAS domain S-box-containing protein
VNPIAEAKRLGAASGLRASEIRYRRLFEAARDGILMLDPGTRKITDANPFMSELLGYPHEELMGKELWEIGLLKDEEHSRAAFGELQEKQFIRYEDLPLQTKAGTRRDVEFVSNIYKEDGRDVIQCNIRDITERKRAEEALRLSEERFRALFELGPVAVYSCDTAGVIQEFNRRAVELWGRKPALGETDEWFCGSYKLFRPDGSFMPHEQCPMAEVIAGKIPAAVDAEVLIERPDGSRRNCLVNIRSLKNEHGEIVGAINCFYDITERKQAEEILRRNEALFSALAAQVPVGVYVVDAKLRLQQVNLRARPVFSGIHPLIGRDFSEIIHTLWPRRVADQIMLRFRRTLKTGVPYQSPEFSERRRDIGVQEIYEWQIQRVTLPAGEHGVVCFFSNITKRKQAEGAQRRLAVLTASNRKLEQEILRRQTLQESLKRSERHQGRLLDQSRQMQDQLRHLSHQILSVQEEERKRISRELHDEIAQILVGITVRLSTLTREAADNPKGLQKKISRTQRLVEKSVDVMHRFARELRPTALDDLGLIPALHTFMEEFTKRTGIHIHFTTFASGRIEQLDTNTSTVLYRVTQEALTNIDRHAHASRVDVSIQKLRRAICLTIKDDGKSFQVDRVLHAKRNKRLGLLGMRERMEMVGGSLGVESTPGQGTTICAQIPFSNGHTGEELADKASARSKL